MEQFQWQVWEDRKEDLVKDEVEICKDIELNLNKLFETEGMLNNWFSYSGSDTQPPCNEDV